jgi:hypothetical protein
MGETSEDDMKAMNDRMSAVSLKILSIKFIVHYLILDAIKNVIIHGYSLRISQ